MNNPLLHISHPVPFAAIRADHVVPAIDELIVDAEEQLHELRHSQEERTFANTLLALESATERLDFALSVVRHLEAVVSTPELRAAFNVVEPKASEFYSKIPLDERLWHQLQRYAATEEARALSGTRARFLKRTLDGFRRAGAELPPEGKKRLAEIDVELTKLTTKFSENVLDATKDWELIIEDEAGLAGLPESARMMARQAAESKEKPGYRFTLQAPSYLAVMTYLDDRSIREQTYRAFNTRATQGEHDNRPLIVSILRLRKEKAQLLGYRDFADLVLADRMAKNGASAQGFLERLEQRTRAPWEAENADLEAFARTQHGAPSSLDPWDVSYYAERLRQQRFDFDEEALRPYFPLGKVVDGMFDIVHRLYGIRVVSHPEVEGWHPDVRYYSLEEDNGTRLAGFYTDWYPRETKRQGAWMDAFLTGYPAPDGFQPHLGLMCGNLTPPIGGKPALLTHRDVETIFHEFGHLLHHCLSTVEIRSLSGTNVAWDFVELPSQIMENWCWEREALDLFARHYETGAPIPEELFERMLRARTFRSASLQMRQLSFGLTDLKLHREYDPARDGDVTDYSRALLQRFTAAPLPGDHAMIAAFTHLFANPVGYGAGYYSYKWAEVLDADAFTRFRDEGIFSREVGQAFREAIIGRGNSEDPADLFRQFMGRDPDPEALMIRSGLVQS